MQPIYTTDKTKGFKVLVGYISDLKHSGQGLVFTKNVKPNHYVIKFDGYGIQSTVFDRLERAGVSTISINRPDTYELWTCPLEAWKNYGITGDLGHGKQVFLSLEKMQYTKTKNDGKLEIVVEHKPSQLNLL